MATLLIKGKIRDGMIMYLNLSSIVLENIAEFFTCKPHYVNYIKTKLRNRFKAKIVSVDKNKNQVSFYLSITQDLTEREKLNTAKAFGLTLRNIKFVKINENRWKIIFLPSGIKLVKALINTFPNWRQQLNTGKTYLDFEPKEEQLLTREQKFKLRKENKKIGAAVSDVLDYLMRVPIIGYLIRQMYWNRQIFRKIFRYMPKDTNDMKLFIWFLVGLLLFYLFMYTFVFWATILCLLIAGYGFHKLKGVIRVKI